MTTWIVIPIKAPDLCKTRLASVLGDRERRDLTAQMLRQVATVSAEVVGRQNVRLLGPSRHGLPESFAMLSDKGTDLNSSLAHARDAAVATGVVRVAFVSADLPQVKAGDIAKLIEVPPDSVTIAADRWGKGTNGLSLPLPQAANFNFHYGQRSFDAHCDEAACLGLPIVAINRHGLQFDIDEPEDLEFYRKIRFASPCRQPIR